MTVSLDATSVEVNTPVNVTWTVDADFSGENLVNMTKLAYGEDSSSRTAQIVHSNVHSCVYLSGCDPFNDGKQLEDKTSNQIANLTDNAADFEDAVQFSTAGAYSVLAHIIMPDTNSSRQFAYAVYIELTVTEATEADTTEAPAATTTEQRRHLTSGAHWDHCGRRCGGRSAGGSCRGGVAPAGQQRERHEQLQLPSTTAVRCSIGTVLAERQGQHSWIGGWHRARDGVVEYSCEQPPSPEPGWHQRLQWIS